MSVSNVKHRVLVVNDEQDVITTVKKGLEAFGFNVDVFTDPREALSQFKPNYYNTIILDIRVPSMSGFELAKEIWAVDEKARICFFTAFEIIETEAKKVFTKFKTHCFIKKPIKSSELAKHIETHLLTAK